jgi:hypothetical protein
MNGKTMFYYSIGMIIMGIIEGFFKGITMSGRGRRRF